MNISIHIDGDSTANELIAVGNFARELAISRGAHVSTGPATATIPADEGDLQEPGVTSVPETPAVAGTEPPKRRRRSSKEEIAAAAAAEVPATEPATETPEPATEPATETPEPATEPATTEEPEAFETVTPATGKNYTEAEVQQIATVVARTHGADKVKNKIAELGAQRIAGLEQGKLNELAIYLEGLK